MGIPAKEALDQGLTNAIDNLVEYYLNAPPRCRVLALQELDHPLSSESPDGTSRTMISSSIGLSGEGFRASLNILAHTSTLVRLCPEQVRHPLDWAGELVNQLIGRVKNMVSEYGVACHMSLPVSVHGADIGYSENLAEAMALHIDTDAGPLVSLWHVRTEPNLEWEHDPDQASADEGSLCLF
ncbi:hypothetical protein [Aeoliella sp.]|uniref:hypothetical protein n=1 Tax=Aeoliella sp. TaxID=2795800 RepID=UPI003CCBD10A